jgi:predicted TIM-barrel fold metal-dependent hydrolase
MDAQGLEAILLFPTLAVGVEQPLRHDAELTHASLEAFNRWLDEDWGFAWRERLFAVPMLSLMDPARAVRELEWALARGARVVHVRPAPVPGATRSFSPGDPVCDPFWSRVGEAGITVAFHAGDSGYGKHAAAWEGDRPMEAFRGHAFGSVTQADRAIYDTLAALVVHGVFQRHPNVRVCSIENGSEWMRPLLRKLRKCQGQFPQLFGEPVDETVRRHVFVAPYYEDDLHELAEAIGIDNILFGSDWPHAEGLAEPTSFAAELAGFSADEVRRIMRENPWRLVTPQRA